MVGHREGEFKYRAFLSDRAADARQAEWRQRKLEEYVVPRALVGTRGVNGILPHRLGRFFRDRDEAPSAERIGSAIAGELSQSQQVIVLCTPNAVAPVSLVEQHQAYKGEVATAAETTPECGDFFGRQRYDYTTRLLQAKSHCYTLAKPAIAQRRSYPVSVLDVGVANGDLTSMVEPI